MIKTMKLTVPIIYLELRSCKQTKVWVKEITQSKERVRRLMDNKLKGGQGHKEHYQWIKKEKD